MSVGDGQSPAPGAIASNACYCSSVPYRDLYRPTLEQSAADTAEIALAIEHQARFGHRTASELWPASTDGPFEAQSLSSFAVSADGTRSILCSNTMAWLVDTRNMRSVAATALPTNCRIAALSRDGSTAALLCGDSLYRWRIGEASPTRVWQSDGLASTDVLELSADGAVAVTSRYSQNATVRVFDFASATLVYSFRADSDECLALHPSGRHILCFGDTSWATIHGRNGVSSRINHTTGGAFSPDGLHLCVNHTDRETACSIYPVEIHDDSLTLGRPQHREAGAELSRWDFQARYAPDGNSVLLAADSGRTCLLDVTSRASKIIGISLKRKTGIVAGGRSLLTGPTSARSVGIRAEGIAVIETQSEFPLGLFCATRDSQPTLAGIATSGFYGNTETSAALGDKHSWPYERPELTSDLLAQQAPKISEEDALNFEEVIARRSVWKPYKSRLAADLTSRQLVDFNQGIIELTPELVHRAIAIASEELRFGKPQLTQHALKAVSDELKALSLEAKRAVFGDMLARLREPLKSSIPSPKPRSLESQAPDLPDEQADDSIDEAWQEDDSIDEVRAVRASTNDDIEPLGFEEIEVLDEENPLALSTTSDSQAMQRRSAGLPTKIGLSVFLTGASYIIAAATGLL